MYVTCLVPITYVFKADSSALNVFYHEMTFYGQDVLHPCSSSYLKRKARLGRDVLILTPSALKPSVSS